MSPPATQFLVLLLCGSMALSGSQAGGAPAQVQLKVVEGSGAAHSIRTRTAVPTVVEVGDAAGHPVPGARVIFTLPEAGAGGTFRHGGRRLEVLTNAAGRAGMEEFLPNATAGRFAIEVEAFAGGETARVTIWQSNSPEGFDSGIREPRNRWKWVVLGMAAGAGVGIGLVLHGRQGPAWSAGQPSIGPPR